MASKLRIKLGALEVDYEGTDEFIKDQLPALLQTLQSMHSLAGGTMDDEKGSANRDSVPSNLPGTVSTNTIAVKLAAKSGSDLLTAAATRLGAVLNKATFTRKELIAEMRAAPNFFKATYIGNLNKSLKVLTDGGVLLLQGENTFALSEAKKIDMVKTLAGAK